MLSTAILKYVLLCLVSGQATDQPSQSCFMLCHAKGTQHLIEDLNRNAIYGRRHLNAQKEVFQKQATTC